MREQIISLLDGARDGLSSADIASIVLGSRDRVQADRAERTLDDMLAKGLIARSVGSNKCLWRKRWFK